MDRLSRSMRIVDYVLLSNMNELYMLYQIGSINIDLIYILRIGCVENILSFV